MIMNKYILLCGLALSTLSLNGCSGIRDTLGLEKESPDEFAVMTRAPLEMPSKLILPPPRLGAARPQEKATSLQAKEALLGQGVQSDNGSSKSENALLERAAADNINPDIRAEIDEESADLQNRNKPVAEKLLNLGGVNKRPSATIIDAKKELERIQNDKKAGKDITGDNAPVIED